MSEWASLKTKIQDADNWRGECNVPIEDETFTVKIRMLTESERQGLLPRINMSALAEHRENEQSDAEEVIENLQDKDELTDAEEARLQEAQLDLAEQRGDLIEALGEETFAAIREAGRLGITPDAEDVTQVLDEHPQESRERFEHIDGVEDVPQDREEAREAIRAEMNHWLERSPYPIQFTVGQRVLRESQGQGN